MSDYDVGLGTELKLNLSIEPIEGITMDEYNFIADIYTSSKRSLSIEKKEAIRIDENNYILRVDTTILGTGNVKLKVTAYIPDRDFADGMRTEVVFVDTKIYIVKNF